MDIPRQQGLPATAWDFRSALALQAVAHNPACHPNPKRSATRRAGSERLGSFTGGPRTCGGSARMRRKARERALCAAARAEGARARARPGLAPPTHTDPAAAGWGAGSHRSGGGWRGSGRRQSGRKQSLIRLPRAQRGGQGIPGAGRKQVRASGRPAPPAPARRRPWGRRGEQNVALGGGSALSIGHERDQWRPGGAGRAARGARPRRQGRGMCGAQSRHVHARARATRGAAPRSFPPRGAPNGGAVGRSRPPRARAAAGAPRVLARAAAGGGGPAPAPSGRARAGPAFRLLPARCPGFRSSRIYTQRETRPKKSIAAPRAPGPDPRKQAAPPGARGRAKCRRRGRAAAASARARGGRVSRETAASCARSERGAGAQGPGSYPRIPAPEPGACGPAPAAPRPRRGFRRRGRAAARRHRVSKTSVKCSAGAAGGGECVRVGQLRRA